MSYPPTSKLECLSLRDLDEQSDAFNAVVRATPEIDRFCSSTYWSVPAHSAFSSFRPAWIRKTPAGYAAMAVGNRHSSGPVLEPLEFIWGAACPWVGPDAHALVESLEQEVLLLQRAQVPVLLTGLQWGGKLFTAVVQRFRRTMDIRHGTVTRCFRARLDDGPDGFLSRRSSGFRTNLRRAVKRAEAESIYYEYVNRFANFDEVRATFRRILAIEHSSWKGMLGTGLADPSMHEFYLQMLKRLWTEQSIRVIIARHGDRDVGFVFGALMDGIYRGLQVSYSMEFDPVGLGNTLQWQMIKRLCQEPCSLYDLGVEVAYKERWGEDIFETVLLMLE